MAPRKRLGQMLHLPSLPKIYNTYFVALIATVGGALFGFDISSMSAIIGTDQYLDFFDNPHGTRQGAIGSALAAGSVVGSVISGPVSDYLGRRDAIQFGCLWWLAGTAIQIAVKGFGTLMTGRMLNGVCVGIASSQVPVYLAEIAKKEKRGQILCLQQLSIEVGILVMYFIGYGCSFIDGPASFRTAWGLQYVPCVILMLGLPFLPESPRWLAKVGRDEEAITILARIQAKGNVHDPLVQAEWQEITATLEVERAAEPGLGKFYKHGMWKRTLAGFSVQSWQQLSGANVMTYYVVYVFQMAGLTGNVNLTSSGIQYALFIIFTVVMLVFIDNVSRRNVLTYGALGMAACHFIVGGILSAAEDVPGGVDGNANVTMKVTGSKSHAVIAFSYMLVIVYALTLAPVAWVYAAEVWSLETRATGMGIAATGNWLFNFALGFFVPPGFLNIKWKMFITFGVLCVLAAIQAFFTYPETCGKSLEEIEELFGPGAPPPWKTKKGGSKLDDMVEQVKDKSDFVETGPTDSEDVEKRAVHIETQSQNA
ncbi:hypothetical protein KEM52_001793 [Ascosphaera acerosa]|nr:hypothetical protein KEM52_001793 [Ascosphaera acerosa]